MTLSRRDRAAMVLALECLRCVGRGFPLPALDSGGPACSEIAFAVRECMPPTGTPWTAGAWAQWRVTCARLALYLRAALRADAGDLGRRVRRTCGGFREWCGPADRPTGYETRCGNCGADWLEHGHPRFTPLWQLAPEHRP